MKSAEKLLAVLPLLAAVSIGFVIASWTDGYHVFQDQRGEWQAVLSSTFIHRLPLAMVAGLLIVAAVLTLASLAQKRYSGDSLAGSLLTMAPAFTPLLIGLLAPLRYLRGLPADSTPLFLLTSSLMIPVFAAASGISAIFIIGTLVKSCRENGKNLLKSPAMTDRSIGWIVAVATALLLSLIIIPKEGNNAFGGDQPHYLIVTHSIIEDGDIFIEDDHEAGAYRSFTDMEIIPQYYRRTTDGRVIPVHKFGISVLAVLPYLLAGRLGVLMMIAAMAGATAANLYWLILKLLNDRSAALLATAWAALTAPVLPLSVLFFTEIPSALFLLVALNLMYQRDLGRPVRFPWLLPFLIWSMPWLHVRNFPVAFLLSVFLVIKLRKKPIIAVAIAALCVLLSLGIPVFNWHYYGSFNPVAEMGDRQGVELGFYNVIRGLGGMLFDQEFGILLYNPAALLALLGLPALFKANRKAFFLLVLVFGFSIGPTTLYHMWWGGGSPPGRYLAADIQLAAIPLAFLFSRVKKGSLRGAIVILILVSVAISSVIVLDDSLMVNDRDGSAKILTAVSAGPIDAVEWWPSWFGGLNRMWILSGIAVLYFGLMIFAVTWMLRRTFDNKGTRQQLLSAGMAFIGVIVLFVPYAHIAEAVSPDEPNGWQPVSHQSDADLLQRSRTTGYALIDIGGNLKLDSLPSRRFSSELLFGIPALVPDEHAGRGRAKVIAVPGETIEINSEEIFWAGTYTVAIGLRSADSSAEVHAAVYNARAVGTDTGYLCGAMRFTTGAEYRQFEVPVLLECNTDSIKISLNTSAELRLTSIILQPLKLVKKADWPYPEDTFRLSGLRWGDLVLHLPEDVGYPAERSGFWTRGDSKWKLTVSSRKRFKNIEIGVSGQPGITMSVTGTTSQTVEFSKKTRSRNLQIPVTLTRRDGFWTAELAIDVTGTYIPSRDGTNSTDERHLGVFIRSCRTR